MGCPQTREDDMAGKTFGQMNADERKAAMRRVADRLQAELQAAAPEITRIMDEAETGPRPAPLCPGCDRVMSLREASEQGACNDCNGGAW